MANKVKKWRDPAGRTTKVEGGALCVEELKGKITPTNKTVIDLLDVEKLSNREVVRIPVEADRKDKNNNNNISR